MLPESKINQPPKLVVFKRIANLTKTNCTFYEELLLSACVYTN